MCSEHARVRMDVCVYVSMDMYLFVQASVPLLLLAPTKPSSVNERASVGAAAAPAVDEEAPVKPASPEAAASLSVGAAAPLAAEEEAPYEPAEEVGEATPDKVAAVPSPYTSIGMHVHVSALDRSRSTVSD